MLSRESSGRLLTPPDNLGPNVRAILALPAGPSLQRAASHYGEYEFAPDKLGDWTLAGKALSEVEKMRRVPGVVFADGPVGRRPRIAGTGLDVFEIIKEYRICERDRGCLAEAFHWLTPDQLQAALSYYETFPEEIDARLELEASLTPEVIRAKYPWPSPQPRTGTR